jgi:hypothetical protein
MATIHERAGRLWSLLFPEVDAPAAGYQSEFERFAIPHTFAPRLSLLDAVVFSLTALARIFLGSLLFALWGVCALTAWTAIHNPLLRVLAVTPLVLAFLLTLALTMIGITLLGNKMRVKR